MIPSLATDSWASPCFCPIPPCPRFPRPPGSLPWRCYGRLMQWLAKLAHGARIVRKSVWELGLNARIWANTTRADGFAFLAGPGSGGSRHQFRLQTRGHSHERWRSEHPRRRPDLAKFWQSLAVFPVIPAEVERKSAGVLRRLWPPKWPKMGQVWPASDRIGRCRPHVGAALVSLGGFRWRMSTRIRSNSVQIFDRCRPRVRPDIGPDSSRANIGLCVPRSARPRYDW